MAELSVLMSLYIKEKPEYAEACFRSLLRQTVQADEWVIVEDGPLNDGLYSLLDRYEKEYPGLIKRVPLPENRGLGLALSAGIPECSNELIARMDTDDIAREDRFEKQLREFEADPELDMCGSNIDEFEDTPDTIVASREVPLNDDAIRKYQRRRDALCGGARKIGWNIPDAKGSMFVWAPVPEGHGNSMEFCMELLEKTGVLCTPGSSFGPSGEGYVRMALVATVPVIEEALKAIESSGIINRK